MKINTVVVKDDKSEEVRHIMFDNEYAEIQVNVCDSLNLIVIHKTFKASKITHSIQMNRNELETIIEQIYNE